MFKRRRPISILTVLLLLISLRDRSSIALLQQVFSVRRGC